MKKPSMSAKLKLKKFRDSKDVKQIKPLRQQYTQDDIKKLFKSWR